MKKNGIALTLHVEPCAVTSGGVVKLKAETSVPAAELAERDFVIKFEAPSPPKAAGGDSCAVEPISFTEAIWNVPKGIAEDVHTVTATLLDAQGEEVASDSSDVTVLRSLDFSVVSTPDEVLEGESVVLKVAGKNDAQIETLKNLKKLQLGIAWDLANVGRLIPEPKDPTTARWETANVAPGVYPVQARIIDRRGAVVLDVNKKSLKRSAEVAVKFRPLAHQDRIPVSLGRTATTPTRDQALWVAIRNRTKAIAFSGSGYKDFIDNVLCKRTPLPQGRTDSALDNQLKELRSDIYGAAGYELLKTATEVFLLLNCGVRIEERDLTRSEIFVDEEESAKVGTSLSLEEIQQRLQVYLGDNQLPYIKRVLQASFGGQNNVSAVHCEGVLNSRVSRPCLLELIWSYWHEEGMLVQTLNAISLRFQNRTTALGPDPLVHMEIDPLRGLNNLLWGYIQDEHNRLTVVRRAHEYDHHYGMTLVGRAVPRLQSVDSRSKFVEAYHNLIHQTALFFKQDDDTTVVADGFPVLNALKEVHLLLAEGAHNQFGDLPWTSRAEMLMQQWLLARPEMRDFLQSRAMVPYKEPWMAQVDTMKRLQGWTDVSVTHFHDLAVFGEQILLSIRYGDWIDVTDAESAKNWARYWRQEIQGYIHAYRTVTGMDLSPQSAGVQLSADRYLPPSVHLRRRLEAQRSGRATTPAVLEAPSPAPPSRNGAPARQAVTAAMRNADLTRGTQAESLQNRAGSGQEI